MLLPSGQKGGHEAAEADEALAAILSAAQGMGETHVLISENGVVVVCRGAASASVKLDIIRAVSSYTGFGSDKITILESDKEGGQMNIPENPHMFNFFIPIIVLVVATIIFDTDMEMGVLTTVVVMFIMYMAQNIMSAMEFWDIIIKGIQNMILPLLLMVMAFVFADMNETIGFTAWCIESATHVMTPATAPMIIFLVLACTEFITGTNWGMYVIALPIIIPLAMNIGVSMPLVVGACISAGVFGSHICFYSDATVLTSAACGCDNFKHALSQMPYGIMAAILSFIGYAIMGFVMA